MIVQTKKLTQEESASIFKASSGLPSTPSVSSFRSSNTGRSKSKAGSVTSRASLRSGYGPPTDEDPTGQIWNLDEDTEMDYGSMAATGHMFEMLQKQVSHTLASQIIIHLLILIFHQKRLSATTTTVAEVQEEDEFQTMQETIKKAAKDLKGKKYIVDKDGNVLPMNPVNPDNLPPYSVSLGLNIASGSGADDGSLGSRSSQGVKKKKKVIRVAGSRTVDESLFKPEISLATTLSGGDLITNVGPGIVLHIDDNTREGPILATDPKKMSKRHYLEKSMMSNSMSQESLNGFGFADSALGMSTDSLLQGVDNLPMSMLSMQLPDVDALEGGRKVMKSESTIIPKDQDPNSVLVAASIASKLPSKQNFKQFENVSLLTGGVEKVHPRDRTLPLSQVPPSQRKHLPAPALGKTTGHGLSPDRSMGSRVGMNSATSLSQVSQKGGSVRGDASVASGATGVGSTRR